MTCENRSTPRGVVRCIAFFLILTPAPAGAAPPPADAPVQSVGEVVSTATRAEREVLDVAANVSVLDRKDIDESGVATLPDLLRRQPGLFVTSTTTNPAGV